jgi:hypothetical protein
VLNPGADPKNLLVYSFVSKTRVVDAVIKRSQAAGASGLPGADASFHFTFAATPRLKGGSAGDATIDLKVTKLQTGVPNDAAPDVKAAMQSLEKAFVGVVAHVDTTAHGEISDPQYEVDSTSDAVDMMTRAVEMLVVPLPLEPVGVGAKWAKTMVLKDENGTDLSGTITMTLLARDSQTATIKVEATNSGRMPIPDPNAPKGAFIRRNTSNTYTTVVRFDGVAARSDGASKLDITPTVPGQPDESVTLIITKSLSSK